MEPEKLETIRVQPVASFHFQPDITGETGEFDLDLDLDFDLDWDLETELYSERERLRGRERGEMDLAGDTLLLLLL